MKISLLNGTQSPIQTVASACWLCTHTEARSPIAFKRDEAIGIVRRTLRMGHYSVMRHVLFSFLVEDVSLVLTHQLVRHHAGMDFSQRSMRYTKADGDRVMPRSISRDSRLLEVADKAVNHAFKAYSELLETGIRPEDARYILPVGVTTNIEVTANGEALKNFFAARLCTKAQWEIRDMAQGMHNLLPFELFHRFGPKCMDAGICKEKNSCGRYKQYEG